MDKLLVYRCKHCGNMLIMVNKGGGAMTCCGSPLEAITPNTTDGAVEKHVPVVENVGGKLKVTVGSVIHPMTEEHYIMWIAVKIKENVYLKYLKPGDEPVAYFDVPEGESGTAYEYCNLHGLWSYDF